MSAGQQVNVEAGSTENQRDNVLEVKALRTVFGTDGGPVPAVDGVSFDVARGRVLALVGESGCGKSVTAFSITRLIQPPGRIDSGTVTFYPKGAPPIEVTSLSEKDDRLYQVRGGLVSMIFQEPMTALSPVHSIGNQICEAILIHQHVSPVEAQALAVEMLGKVGIPDPARRLAQYPHEMSGGMRQRVVIAMALVCRPQLLIADEPTTALDVTTQAQILRLIKSLQQELNTAVLLITHDLGVVAQVADDVAVMYLGRIIEQADVRTILKQPKHPYTRGLLSSLPSRHGGAGRLPYIPGSVPPLTDLPPGCAFHPRCGLRRMGRCDHETPVLREVAPGHFATCDRAGEAQP